MARPTLKKDTAGPSMSPPGTSSSSSAPSRCPRLTKTVVFKAILQLGDTRGSSMQSILTKLRRRPGAESITRVQLEKALDRLLVDKVVKKVKEERFFLSTDTKKSTAKKQNTANTKTASTASPSVASSTVVKVRAARTTKAADVKTSTTDAAADKTRPTKFHAVAVIPKGKKSSNAIAFRIPLKADRDRNVGSTQVPNRRRHDKPRRVTFGNADVVMVDVPPEGSKMAVDADPGSSTRGLDEIKSAETGDMAGGRSSFTEAQLGTDPKMSFKCFKIPFPSGL